MLTLIAVLIFVGLCSLLGAYAQQGICDEKTASDFAEGAVLGAICGAGVVVTVAYVVFSILGLEAVCYLSGLVRDCAF